MIKNPYKPEGRIYIPLRMVGMSVNSFLTDNEEAFEKDLENNKLGVVAYQVDTLSFNMIRPTPFLFRYNFFMEMCETEVTQKLFQAVMGWNNSDNKSSPQNPVECVTWYDCISFCNELSKLLGFEECYKISDVKMDDVHIKKAKVTWDKTKKGFRLPTEREWEFFAKAGTNNKWSGTDNEKSLGQYAWYRSNSGYGAHSVGKKLPNEWGLYDMTGNVSEWCWDLWAPEDNEEDHVTCGGFYMNHPDKCLISKHEGSMADILSETLGFRVCKSFN